MPITDERESDRVVGALNEAGQRLAQARRQSDAMAAKVAASERLAALVRIAAGVAHETRNPIAAMRLRIENALAGDPARQSAALETNLIQIARVDALIAERLAMTQRQTPALRNVPMVTFLAERAREHREVADEARVLLEVATVAGWCWTRPEGPRAGATFVIELPQADDANNLGRSRRRCPARQHRRDDVRWGACPDHGAGW